ncbi:aminobenzoyl-glutamate transporter, partial [candidate division KSB1 bacterium]
VAFVQRYSKEAGIGTVIATMVPYTVAFLIVWSVMLAIWVLLDIPVGPGARLYLAE